MYPTPLAGQMLNATAAPGQLRGVTSALVEGWEHLPSRLQRLMLRDAHGRGLQDGVLGLGDDDGACTGSYPPSNDCCYQYLDDFQRVSTLLLTTEH